jgi:hypothetical protein
VPRHLPTVSALAGIVEGPAVAPEPLRVRTVTDGKLHHVSASQVQTFESCNRKWWFQKVQQIPDRTDTSSRDLGTEVHAILESYLKGGPTPSMGSPLLAERIAASGLIHLPQPGPELQVEQLLDPPLLFAGETPWEGKIDWLTQPTEYTDPVTGQHWHQFQVGDHKTTKNFRYAKSSSELRTLTQFVSYAYWKALQVWGPGVFTQGGYRIMGTHVYYHTQPENLGARAARSKRVDCWLETKDIPALVSALNRTVADMVVTATKTNQEDVPGERATCGAFGGCPFRMQCTIGRRTMNNESTGLPNSLNSLLRKPVGSGPAPTPVAPSAAGEGPVEQPIPGELALAGWAPKAPVLPGPAELVLYVGCLPLVGPHAGVARPLEEVVEAHSQAIREEQGVVDLRLMQFAAGKALLAGSLRTTPPTGVYFVNRSHEMVAVALETLIPLADVVIQGVAT